jgi:hypothetical protein
VHKQHYSFTLFPSFPSVQRFSCAVQTHLEQKATKATKSENPAPNGGETCPGVIGIGSSIPARRERLSPKEPTMESDPALPIRSIGHPACLFLAEINKATQLHL